VRPRVLAEFEDSALMRVFADVDSFFPVHAVAVEETVGRHASKWWEKWKVHATISTRSPRSAD
jgi:hypothetical protein